MLGCENVSLIFGWELLAFVESHLEGSVVRLQQHIGNNDLLFQLRMFTLMARILVTADVPPGPAIKSASFDMGDVVGRKIVSQAVTFVDRAPQLTRLRIDRQPTSRIADPIRVDL